MRFVRSPEFAVVGLLAATNSCISTAVHKNVPAFADAVSLATENSKFAFNAVETEADRIVVNYDTKGFRPDMVKRFLEPEDLNIRLTLLDALQGPKVRR
jgi:hypothetical protein